MIGRLGPLIALLATALFFALAWANEGWARFWFGLLTVGGVAETIALARPQKNDTFTEAVRKNSKALWAVILLGVFLVWLLYHFTIEGRM